MSWQDFASMILIPLLALVVGGVLPAVLGLVYSNMRAEMQSLRERIVTMEGEHSNGELIIYRLTEVERQVRQVYQAVESIRSGGGHE